MTKTLYIAGCGRSGSTLLERILNSHDRLFATGELCYFLDSIDFDPNSKSYRDPEREFWSKVARDSLDDSSNLKQLRKNQLAFESILGLIQCFRGNQFKSALDYQAFNHRLFSAIEKYIPPATEYLIDSSKTARLAFLRPISLSKFENRDVKVIHLVRDGRGCIWSYLKGSNRKMERGLDARIPFAAVRCSLTWFIAQTAAHIFQICHSSDHYLRVRYEDFVDNPKKTLNTIGAFLGIDFSRQIEMIQQGLDIPIAEQISGNRIRNQSKIILKKDWEWKQNLRWYHQLLFWTIDWHYALLYGYGSIGKFHKNSYEDRNSVDSQT